MQQVAVIIIVLAAVGYAIFWAIQKIKNAKNPCDGCSGCQLKDLKNCQNQKKSCCCAKK